MPGCFNCGSPHHYSERCTKPQRARAPQQQTECYTCRQVGHKADRCPSAAAAERGQKEHMVCYQCGERGHKARDCQRVLPYPAPAAARASVPVIESEAAAARPRSADSHKATLVLDGMWRERSAFVHAECGLYKLKKGVTAALIEAGVMDEKDMDLRNRTPHVELVHQGTANVDSPEYLRLHKTIVGVSHEDFHFTRNLIELTNVGAGKHYSLCFKTDGGFDSMDRGRLWQLIDPVIAKIRVDGSSSSSSSNECPVCMAAEANTVVVPCGHAFCSGCIDRAGNKCAGCRGPVVSKQSVYRLL